MTIYRGDDTGSFGGTFLTVNVTNETGEPIVKAIWVCGDIQKEFDNPVFPLTINLNSRETKKCFNENTCYLVCFDEEGRQKTATGSLTFNTTAGVYHGKHCC